MEPWDRQPKELAIWHRRFLGYRDMGPERSMLGFYNRYSAKPARNVPGAWKQAAERDNWQARAEAYDAMLYAEKERRASILRQIEEQEIQRILTTDYATKHERIKALAKMAHTVEKSFIDADTQEVTYKFMTPDKLREWRGMLDDIAKELGDRTIKKELTGKDGGPIEIETVWGGGILDEDDGEKGKTS